MPSPRLYDNLPHYMQLFDDQDQIIKFLCDVGLQPEFDIHLNFTRQLENYFNPDHPLAAARLDWLGQLVGLGAINGHYLGIGINPNWKNADKIRLIKSAWDYWQQKGTEPGIRKAIDLWLLWQRQSTRLTISQPIDQNAGVWTYQTPYNYNWGKSFNDIKYLASGDYPQQHQPEWIKLQHTTNYWQYGTVWNDSTIEATPAPLINTQGSRLGARHVWMEFECNEQDWSTVFPDYHTLALEIFPVLARQYPFIYFDLSNDTTLNLPRKEPDPGDGSVVIDFDVDGYYYGWMYPYPAIINPPPYIEETIVTTSFGFYPGFGYGQRWGSLGDTFTTTSTTTQTIQGYSGGWQWNSDRYGGEIVETTVIIDVEVFTTADYSMGWETRFGYVWNTSGDVTTESTETTITELGMRFWNGIDYTQEITSTITTEVDPTPALTWFTQYQTITEIIRTEIDPPSYESCSLWGIFIDAEIGTEKIEVITPEVAPNIRAELVGETVETVVISPTILGSIGWQWGYAYQSLFSYFEDILEAWDGDLFVDSIFAEGITLDDQLIIETLIDTSGLVLGNYQYYGQDEVTETIVTPEHLELLPTNMTATNWLYWTPSMLYPFMGSAEIITTVEQPIYDTVQLCNVPGRWTTKKIIRYEEIIIPPEDLDIPLEELYPLLSNALNGNQWRVLIETTNGVIVQNPTVIRLLNSQGSPMLKPIGNTGETVNLDFAMINTDCLVSSITVLLENTVVASINFDQIKDWSNQTALVIKLEVALNYEMAGGVI